MQQIWKYPVPGSAAKIEMPASAQILTMQMQQGVPVFWAVVKPDNPKQLRHFEIFATGQPMAELLEWQQRKYIGTWQSLGGSYVLHLFEIEAIEVF